MGTSGCTQGTHTAALFGCRREWRIERGCLVPRLSPGRRARQVFFPYVALYLAAAFLQGGAGTGASGVLNNIRTWLWFSISQSAYRTISLDMFSHVLDLDLKFHLMCGLLLHPCYPAYPRTPHCFVQHVLHAHDLDLAPMENALPQACMKLVHCPMGCHCRATVVEASAILALAGGLTGCLYLYNVI
jgi:hypothetical protein